MLKKTLTATVAAAAFAVMAAPTGVGATTLLDARPGVPVPVASQNVELLATIPDVGAISTAFSQFEPLMYVNTLNGVSIYDISDPELPLLTGALPLPHFENESMSLGERADGTKFVIIGVDVHAVTPTDTARPAIVGTSQKHLIIVDVTDPANPRMRGRTNTSSSTHTVQCIPPDCLYAYTSGAYQNGKFHVIDLSNLDSPKEIAELRNVAGVWPNPTNIGGHQWDLDDNGAIWSSGGAGLAGYDISDPLNPQLLASTDPNGTKTPYNDFIIHNSYHPNAKAFTQTPILDENGVQIGLTSGEPSTAAGNVILATEEDYDNPVCGGNAGEGTFSTWYIPYLDNTQSLIDNPDQKPNKGKISVLDSWNTEILNSGQRTVAGALCSAHYFTFHDAGFIAQGWYGQGTRILDVRDPRDIKQVGYFFTGASETWHAYWVPERDAQGAATGRDTNIVYTNDTARGIDILRVTLPATAPAQTTDLTAPILPEWLSTGSVPASSPASKRLGYLCRIPSGTVR
jgi:hypothetical protein